MFLPRMDTRPASWPAVNILTRWLSPDRVGWTRGSHYDSIQAVWRLLSFLPTITNRGTIRLQVAPEVSALDYGNAVNIGGATVPALTIRRVKTEVELG